MPNKDPSKRNRNNKIKGRAFQGKIAKILREFFPGTRNTGVHQPKGECDVEGTPFWVECKTGKKPSITRAFIQALGDNDKDKDKVKRIPLVVTHHENIIGSQSLDLATVEMCVFMELIASMLDKPPFCPTSQLTWKALKGINKEDKK